MYWSRLYSSGTPSLISKYRNEFYPRMSLIAELNFFLIYFRVAPLLPDVLKLPVRTVTYFSSRKGKRKTVKAVVYRFLRLHSGLWLRRKVSLHTVIWLKKEWEQMKMKNSGRLFLDISLSRWPEAFTVLGSSTSLAGVSSCQWTRVRRTCVSIHKTSIIHSGSSPHCRLSSSQVSYVSGVSSDHQQPCDTPPVW